MIIKQITQNKSSQYQIYEESEGLPLITFLSEEIGEIMGYTNETILCLKEGRYYIFSLQGEMINCFCKFANPYPIAISIQIGEVEFSVNAKNEEEEMVYRKAAKTLTEIPGETITEKIEVLMSHLIEEQIECEEVELYMYCKKKMPVFLAKELENSHFFFSKEEKICSLAFRISTLLIMFHNRCCIKKI